MPGESATHRRKQARQSTREIRRGSRRKRRPKNSRRAKLEGPESISPARAADQGMLAGCPNTVRTPALVAAVMICTASTPEPMIAKAGRSNGTPLRIHHAHRRGLVGMLRRAVSTLGRNCRAVRQMPPRKISLRLIVQYPQSSRRSAHHGQKRSMRQHYPRPAPVQSGLAARWREEAKLKKPAESPTGDRRSR